MEETDSTSGNESGAGEPVIIKKKGGNPNFVKGKKNIYYNKDNKKMPETDTKTDTNSSGPGDVKSIPIDIFSDKIASEIIPMDDQVEQKDYGNLKNPGDNSGGSGGGNNTTDSGGGTSDNSGGSSKPDSATVNSATPEKTPEEIRTEAEQAVALALRGYDKTHGFARYLTIKDQNKLAGDHAAGKLNLNMSLPLGKGGSTITVGEFIQSYNEQINENIKVSERFKTEITPPLVRIAIKRGWGLSDEMTVLALVAEDLGTKVGLLFGLNKSANMILELSYNQMKAQNTPKAEPIKQKEPEYAQTETVFDESKNWSDAPSA